MIILAHIEFLSTPSARRATWAETHVYGWVDISIHALREEGDAWFWPTAQGPAYFYPRPPRGGRPARRLDPREVIKFLSTPSARRATARCFLSEQVYQISIHALREEGDSGIAWKSPCGPISIHALREEGDGMTWIVSWYLFNFYPRPPRGGRRKHLDVAVDTHEFLSTPSARRATQRGRRQPQRCGISIHALREEGDLLACQTKSPSTYFYPRPPRGGRPVKRAVWAALMAISIHALREEGDLKAFVAMFFEPEFLSTPSARRATALCGKEGKIVMISIHALREEGDHSAGRRMRTSGLFLSTPSARRATGGAMERRRSVQYFYPRPPRGGRPGFLPWTTKPNYFYPRPPRGGRRIIFSMLISSNFYFYPRPPRGGRQQKQRQNLYFQTNCTTFCTNLEEP